MSNSMHESESGLGRQVEHESDTGKLLGADALQAAAARRERLQEMRETLPELTPLIRQETVMPSAAQWSSFSKELSRKLDAESATSGYASWKMSWRDRLRATDSQTLRRAVVALAVAATAAIVGLLAYVTTELIPAPAPAISYYQPQPLSPASAVWS